MKQQSEATIFFAESNKFCHLLRNKQRRRRTRLFFFLTKSETELKINSSLSFQTDTYIQRLSYFRNKDAN